MTANETRRATGPPRAEAFQMPDDVAEAYEAQFVPALFAAWAQQLVDAVEPRVGERVLDVACGTGIVARTVADRAPGAAVEGLDLNPAMLAVARRIRPDLVWRQGDAADLPCAPGTFDLVTCQAALMFVPDPVTALREAARVTAPGGRVGLLVVGRLASCPAHATLVEVVERHAGAAAAELVRGYFALGEPDRLRDLLAAADLHVRSWQTTTTDFLRDSVDDFVATEVEATPLRSRLDDGTYSTIQADARGRLHGYDRAGGGVAVPLEAHVVVAQPMR